MDDTNRNLDIVPEAVLTNKGKTFTSSDTITITSPVINHTFRVMDIRFAYRAKLSLYITISLIGFKSNDYVLKVS